MQRLRDVRDHLAALGKTRAASARVVRHSVRWRNRRMPVVREQENAGHLDLLGVSCLMLTRRALATDPADGRVLAGVVGQIAELLVDLALAPGETSVRQDVVDRLPAILREFGAVPTAPDSPLGVAMAALQMVAVDVMVFAGAYPADAAAAVRDASRPE